MHHNQQRYHDYYKSILGFQFANRELEKLEKQSTMDLTEKVNKLLFYENIMLQKAKEVREMNMLNVAYDDYPQYKDKLMLYNELSQ